MRALHCSYLLLTSTFQVWEVIAFDEDQTAVKDSMSTEETSGLEYSFDVHQGSNDTSTSHSHMKREIKIVSQQKNTWERSQISVPPKRNWYEEDEDGDATWVEVFASDGLRRYNSWWDDSYGSGQTIYFLDDDFRPSHNVRFSWDRHTANPFFTLAVSNQHI